MTEIEKETEAGGAAEISLEASGASEETSAGGPVGRHRPRKPKQKPLGRALTPEERLAERLAARRQKASARRVQRAANRTEHKAAAHDRQATPPRVHGAGLQKLRQGTVVSDKAQKTITVRIDVARRHRRYEKIVRTSSTVHAHDERNEAHIGDTVLVRESRPLSRTKRWRLVEIVERAK